MGKPKTSEAKIERIKYLRSRGYSLPEIARELKVGKTTVLRYIQDVKMLPEFEKGWLGKRGGSKKRQAFKQLQALGEAKKQVQLSETSKMLFLAALYWAEGSKKDFGLSNTDPILVELFINGLREVFNIEEDRFRISVRIYEDLDKKECLEFWSKIVNVPIEKFLRVDVLSGKKKGKLKYGMCRVRITKGGDLLKKMVAINKVVAEQFSSRSSTDRAAQS